RTGSGQRGGVGGWGPVLFVPRLLWVGSVLHPVLISSRRVGGCVASGPARRRGNLAPRCRPSLMGAWRWRTARPLVLRTARRARLHPRADSQALRLEAQQVKAAGVEWKI